MDDNDLRFYIIMRSDIASLASDPGKASPQAAHAQRQADVLIDQEKLWGDKMRDMYQRWDAQSGGNFGTTIVLKATIDQIREKGMNAREYLVPFGIIHDPTFPVTDGVLATTMPVDTCAWAFGYKQDVERFMSGLDLL